MNQLLSDGRKFLLNTDTPTYVDFTFAALAGLTFDPKEYGGNALHEKTRKVQSEKILYSETGTNFYLIYVDLNLFCIKYCSFQGARGDAWPQRCKRSQEAQRDTCWEVCPQDVQRLQTYMFVLRLGKVLADRTATRFLLKCREIHSISIDMPCTRVFFHSVS